ncbi:hypothetical protein MHH56_15405 [Paenibacillus sp. FSL K6-3182]
MSTRIQQFHKQDSKESRLAMSIISNGNQILPGTAIYSLLKRHIGSIIYITTSTGNEEGQLMAFNANFLTITTTALETKYVLTAELVSFTFRS